ncbi:SH3 domain-containing protein [Oscillatoria sp. FACHB-1406]|uniref:SH3 domain-containing protein n=1 Tax=Oscillatoria sp. FACHB-1406 TaxID=2692846 RepID=UPI001686A863|nr:SH3 domain-containing protein [Oscillatoria sp. FACHB-1406]MBD2577005.1 SH3 domain-containing protein [Oscillatoria sp. FACHB-1406]
MLSNGLVVLWRSSVPHLQEIMKFLQLLTTTAFTVAIASSSATAAEIIATQTNETIGNGLQVYSVRLVDDSGNTVKTVRAVSGRAGQQTPSNRAGSQTPLPFGVYRFDNPGSVINVGGEFGGAWSAITPTFSTERSGLGLHYDPSAFKNNGQAGTAGCLATPTVAERDLVSNFIRTYRPTQLSVISEQLIPIKN